MNRLTAQPDWRYRTLLIIWSFMLGAQFLFIFLVYEIQPELFRLDKTELFIGNHYVLVPLALLLLIEEVVVSYIRHKRYITESVNNQDPERVQTALIIPASNALTISLCGVFLALFFNYQYFYIWILVGILVTIYYFPKRRDLENASPQVTL